LLYGQTKSNPASRFLSEIPEELLEMPKPEARIPVSGYGAPMGGYRPAAPAYRNAGQGAAGSTIGRPAAKPAAPLEQLSPGDRVRHMLFGEGTVLTVTKMGADLLYEIAFDTKGTKKLMATYAKIKKI
jgi:DNA helicase-2/ATP-dependent DNA helicase PcrA